MAIKFYPYSEDLEASTLSEKLTLLLDAAERYKAVILEMGAKPLEEGNKKQMAPRDLTVAFNWNEISKVLQQIRNMPEATSNNKAVKAEHLTKLAGVYEVLRGAKMAKLEAVRLALVNEASQLRAGLGSSEVA